MVRPQVLLLGAYGQDNLGDEAILETHLQQLAGHGVVVASSNPEQTAARYGVESIPTYGAATMRALLRARHVVFGGGSVLKELPPPHARHRLLGGIAGAALARGGRVHLSAVGVERLRTSAGRRLARLAATRCGLLHVRDEGSARLLRETGVEREARVVADPAFLLEAPRRRVVHADGRPLVVLNPMRSGEVECSRERVVEAFTALATHARRAHDARVVALPFKTSGLDEDVSLAREIGVPVLPPMRPSEALAALADADLFVGMRHHGVLLALHADTPALAIPYAPKTEHLVDEMGLREHALSASDLGADALVAAFDRAMSQRREITVAAQKPLRAQRERARENFDVLRRRLAGGEG